MLLVFNTNLITNGDAETGACAANTSISSPKGWSFSGPITQVYYTNTAFTPEYKNAPRIRYNTKMKT